ncbi:hypothetical protein HY491_02860, partial [Candidatus Woesearchaeota archaeon]|nr:hypothetical protein [Candidatus Woesearchaeota archaeon]
MKGNKYEYVVHQSHAAMALAGRGDAPSGSARGRSPSSRHDGGVRQGNGDGVIGRKSQITLFIIIGLVIILAVGATIYITRTVEFQRETAIPQAEQISTQFEPVRQYIQSCLRQTGIQALQLIGQQGGYAYPEEQGIIAIEQAPTESTAVTFSRDVPYWHYLESRNSCSGDCRLSNRLHLRLLGDTAVNKELDKYINRELANCLDFTALNAQGFTITMAGSPESRTVIGESDVTFSAQLPVDIRQGNARQKLEQFVSPLGYNFKALYDTASQLADEMRSSSFLELATLT